MSPELVFLHKISCVTQTWIIFYFIRYAHNNKCMTISNPFTVNTRMTLNTVVWWLALSHHSKKDLDSNPLADRGLSAL